MDDQNKKGPYDDFFDDKTGGSSEQNENNHSESDSHAQHDDGAQDDQTSNKSSYYYSYGPFKPGAQDGRYNNSFRQQPEQNDRSDANAADGRDHKNDWPEAARAPQGESRTQHDGYPEQAYGHDQQEQGNVIPMHNRPFMPVAAASSNSRGGGWQMSEKRRSSWKGMFAAFMAGIIVVGALSYAADTNNWFTKKAAVASSTNQTGTAVSASVGGAGVSNAADVVRPNNIAKIFEQASPAVVKIETFVKQQQRQQGSGGLFDDPFFRQFFGDDNSGNGKQDQQQQQGQSELTPQGIGTGFFFDETGYILTNQHVVASSDEIEVTVQGYDKPFKAKLLGSSFDLDLAVLKVEGEKPFPTLALGSSDSINIGDWVVAIGNPYGFDHTVTIGVLSAKERPIDIPDEDGTREYKHLLQTDASINPGNSGGPLLNLQGEVVGINTAVSSQAQGIGFAIPTSTIQEVLDSLKNNKEIPKAPAPFIGVDLQDLNEQYSKQLGLETTEGVLVTGVYYKSPAYNADVRQYDVITGVNGTKYGTSDKLKAAIQEHKVGEQITLNVIRNGKQIDVPVSIGDKNQFNIEQ
ncbi:S1C family serine protease [Paenibacillus kobensis]|uniref:S1C family serine protease n=1 Tax=Paenibacillus kobensis TaxID=59841 RepID=UPI000FDA5581|nr:trypsin-like peptidase domain-containing protein [Paenibacillus kobensis]